ncbi:MAG TPA: hypothetical protein VFO60_04905 [Candidatus Dormibacteraeota bacterium]|nr:hypothetical protein [Candidatus Dormibacteraeota bacterium]
MVPALVVMGAAAQVGCGSSSSGPTATCQFGFGATVLAGPSAGLHVSGSYLPVSTPPQSLRGSLSGYVVPKSGTDSTLHSLEAIGVESAGTIDVFITLPDQTKLEFRGSEQAPVTSCKGAMSGTTLGPQPGDTGVWSAGQIALSSGS